MLWIVRDQKAGHGLDAKIRSIYNSGQIIRYYSELNLKVSKDIWNHGSTQWKIVQKLNSDLFGDELTVTQQLGRYVNLSLKIYLEKRPAHIHHVVSRNVKVYEWRITHSNQLEIRGSFSWSTTWNRALKLKLPAVKMTVPIIINNAFYQFKMANLRNFVVTATTSSCSLQNWHFLYGTYSTFMTLKSWKT